MASTATTITSNIITSNAAREARPRILVADDSRVIRQAVRKILDSNFEVIQAENGTVAWEMIQQDATLKALITDIEMPGLDGYGLICQIRGIDEGRIRDMPIIAITGADDEETRQRAFACGATDFITKPIDAIQLQARVQAYMRYDQHTRELAERSEALEQQAIDDPATGLRSRRYFLERGEQDIAFAVRRVKDVTLLRIDIDGFKKIYRMHGDEVSDRLLGWLAKILFETARTEDTVARIGGAEFAIMATATDIETATTLCQRVRKAVAEAPFTTNEIKIPITLSMGLASLRQDRQENIDGLLRLAQQRLCHAQSEGGDRFCTSILGDTLPAVEEVLVAPLEVANDKVEPVVIEVEAEAPMPIPAPVDEVPMLVAESIVPDVEVPPANSPPQEQPLSNTASDMTVPVELLSVDKALQFIAHGKGEVLLPYLEQLVQQLKPLLDFCREARNAQKK